MVDLTNVVWKKSSRSAANDQCLEVAGLDRPLWRKSSRSTASNQCLEVAGLDRPLWTKASRSTANNQCVEVATDARVVAVRDSKDPTGPTLPFVAVAWTLFLADVKTNEPGL